MADMTHKHHRLIADGIINGVENFINRPQFKRAVDDTKHRLGIDDVSVQKSIVVPLVRSLLVSLGDAMAQRLAYTNDKFDTNKWVAQLTFCSDDVARKFEN